MNLDHLPILDHHAHAVFREAEWRKTRLESYFTEAFDPLILERDTPHGLFFRRSMRDLAAFYGCEATSQAVQQARLAAEYPALIRRMMDVSHIESVLIDDGFMTAELFSVAECKAAFGCPTQRVLRLETELAQLVPQAETAAQLLDAFEAHLYKLAPTVVSLKSVIAYRCGLHITKHDQAAVEEVYLELKSKLGPDEVPRLSAKPLLDEALWRALRVAGQTGLPVQFHTGYGDPDLDLRLANPLLLREIFEDKNLQGVNVVMLHCYPYTREAGYLASVYPVAYLDLGLSIPFTSVDAMQTHMREALHLAPLNKILFSTDASRTPELYYLGALWGRQTIGKVLSETVANGDLTPDEAEEAARWLLAENARRLYFEGEKNE